MLGNYRDTVKGSQKCCFYNQAGGGIPRPLFEASVWMINGLEVPIGVTGMIVFNLFFTSLNSSSSVSVHWKALNFEVNLLILGITVLTSGTKLESWLRNSTKD